IRLEAAPLDAKRTFIHLSYGYTLGSMARLAMDAYLMGPGRDKIGFSVVERRVFRLLHRDVPELGDTLALEAEDMHHRHRPHLRRVLHSRMHRHQVAVLERALELDRGVRKLRRRLLHPGAQ